MANTKNTGGESRRVNNIDDTRAEAKPKHGPVKGPLNEPRPKDVGAARQGVESSKEFFQLASEKIYPTEFPVTEIYTHFCAQRWVDFITLKCNKGKRFQKIDQVRHLLARHYDSYVIVGSPVGGRHWHAIGSRAVARTLKVPRGIHLKVSRVGTSEFTYANRPDGDPLDIQSSILTQIRYVRKKVAATVVGQRASYHTQMISVIFYLWENLTENDIYNRWENIALRYPRKFSC